MPEIIDYGSWLGDIKKASSLFDCGESHVNDYFKKGSGNDSSRRLLLYVSENQILGFVTVSLANLKVSIQNHNEIETDAVLYINGLGVDRKHHREKIGSHLLQVAFSISLSIDMMAPIKGVYLVALREAMDFCDEFEFTYLSRDPMSDFNSKEFPMFLSIETIKDLGILPYLNAYELNDE